MHKDKEENSHHDSHYRARELAALAAYDHHHLDGEMFLQVSTRRRRSLRRTARIYGLIWRQQIFKMHIGPLAHARARVFIAPARDTPASSALSIDRLVSPTVAEKSIFANEISPLIHMLGAKRERKKKSTGDSDEQSSEIFKRLGDTVVLSKGSVSREVVAWCISVLWYIQYSKYHRSIFSFLAISCTDIVASASACAIETSCVAWCACGGEFSICSAALR